MKYTVVLRHGYDEMIFTFDTMIEAASFIKTVAHHVAEETNKDLKVLITFEPNKNKDESKEEK